MQSGPDESPDQKFQNHLFAARSEIRSEKLRRRHPEMSDAAVGIAHQQRGLVTMSLAQDGLDLVATRVEIGRMCIKRQLVGSSHMRTLASDSRQSIWCRTSRHPKRQRAPAEFEQNPD
jgi:hypothetical protein